MRKAVQRQVLAALATLVGIALVTTGAGAQKKYDPGVSDTEIKIGNIMPYSGPASPYGVIGKTEAAYFNKINTEGGINGRKITFISYDDGYSPAKTVEQARKLVESDEVLLIFNSLGTPPNTAIRSYMNKRGVPQLFVATGATMWGDFKHFPWTMGWQPSYQSEARIYAKYILKEMPDAKLAVLYQNDDYGKDYLTGLKEGLGAKAASMIVAEETYEAVEPTMDSHVVKLKASNADVFLDFAGAKAAAQTIKKMAEVGWKPKLHLLNSVSTSIAAVMKPAGLDASQGVISVAYVMDPTDPQWENHPAMKEWVAFMDKDNPAGNKIDSFNVYAYNVARTLVQVLKQCGDDLTRANVMKQAANLKNFESGPLLPGIKINTSPTDYYPIEQLQLMKFEGESWKLFGPIMSSED